MKNKKYLVIAILVLIAAFALVFAACDGLPEPVNPNLPPKTDKPDTSNDGNIDKTFTGLTLSNLTVDYDGQEHEITVQGNIPEGANVVYQNNKATAIGEYDVTATVSKEGYTTLTLTAKLIITKPHFKGLTLGDVTVDYDGQEHSVTIQGEVPEGANVAYQNNKAIAPGEYNVTATVSKEGYETLTLTAKLVINKLNFTGLTFNGITVNYDGREHVVAVQGNVPAGADVSYQSNKGTNAGTYNATVTVSKEHYNTLTLSAKLVINKIDFVGLTLKNKTVVYTGGEHKVEVEGTLPEGSNVAYQNNKATQEGTYNVTATVTNPNYNTLTLTATLKIIKVSGVASTIVNSLVEAPDPWNFIPEGLHLDNMFYAQMPVNDFTSFVNVSQIGKKAIGKQLNVLYEGLQHTMSALAYVDKAYAVAGTIAEVYQTFINNNPEDYAEFSGEAGGFKIYIKLNGDDYLMLAGNSAVSMELAYNNETKERSGRIQVTDGVAIKYQASDTHLKLAVKATVSGVGNIKQIEFAQNEETVSGYLYEYTGTENKNLKTSAVIAFNSTKTVIVSNKRETDDLPIKGYEEVYNSQTGEYVGGEVGETVNVKLGQAEFDTLWFMLDNVSGINSVKAIHEQNGMNMDTIYINNSAESIHTKLIGGVSLKTASRRFDIEMKDVWYIVKTTDSEGEVTYEKQKASIPMLFVQHENTDTFGKDMYDANKNSGMTSQPTLSSADISNITVDYESMAQLFATIKEQVTFADINNYIGNKNPYFEKQDNA